MYLVPGAELNGEFARMLQILVRLTYPINGPFATLVCVQIINVTKERSRKKE
jgi:hypothetical protein